MDVPGRVATGTAGTGDVTIRTASRSVVTSHPTGGRRVGALFTVAAVWSWGLLAVARSLGGTAPSAGVAALRAVAAAGPLVATHVLLRRTVAYEQRTWFWRRYLEIRSVSRNWWAAAVLLASVPPIAAAGIDWSGWGVGRLGAVAIVPGAALLGLIQEAAWRGYAWDGLRRRPLIGSVTLWAGWALWATAWPVVGGLEGLHGVDGGRVGWLYLAGAMLPQTVLMNWLTVRVRPCLVPAALFNATVLALWAIVEVGDRGRILEVALWSLAAAPVVVSWIRDPRAAAGPGPIR